MGLAAKLMARLKKDKACKGAFSPRTKRITNLCVFEDATGRLIRTIRNRNKSRMMTGNEWAEQALRGIMEYITGPSGCKHYVIGLDDKDRTPPQKSATHDDRDGKGKEGAIKPYPAGSTIVSGGVFQPDHGLSPMNMDRVGVSRFIRRSLFDFLREYLTIHGVPSGCCLYLDYHPLGPWRFEDGKRPVQMTSLMHPFGEPDLQVMLWQRYFRYTGDFIVDTIDSDLHLQLLNGLAGLPEEDKRYNVLATYTETVDVEEEKKPTTTGKKRKVPAGVVAPDKEKKTVYVDMKALLKGIGDRLVALTLICILCGTDFHKKKLCIYLVGTEKLLEWAVMTKPRVTSWKGWDLTAFLESVPHVWRGELAPLAHPDLLPGEGKGTTAENGDEDSDTEGFFVKQARASIAARRRKTTSALGMLEAIVKEATIWVNGKKGKQFADDHFTREGGVSVFWNLAYWLVNWTAIQQRERAPTVVVTSQR